MPHIHEHISSGKEKIKYATLNTKSIHNYSQPHHHPTTDRLDHQRRLMTSRDGGGLQGRQLRILEDQVLEVQINLMTKQKILTQV